MLDFKPGDIVKHKATLKRCVVKHVDGKRVTVTTQDDKVNVYVPEELEPYNEPNKNKSGEATKGS